MNVVALLGNVASEPELRQTAGGKSVCSFRIAINRPGGNSQADFFSVVCWERQAEICNEYLEVGRRVAIEGRLHHSSWETEAGDKRSKVEVVAHRVELLGSRKDGDAASDDAPADEPMAAVVADDDDIPF